MSCGAAPRFGADPAWLWLAAAALSHPLAWELPYAAGGALKRPKKPSCIVIKIRAVLASRADTDCKGAGGSFLE